MAAEARGSGGGSESRALGTFREIFASGRPLLFVRTAEERRLAALLAEAARSCFPAPVPVWSWSLTEGMLDARGASAGEEARGPMGALDFAAAHAGPALFHLKDFHEPMRASAEVRRRLRDLYARCLDAGKFVVISSPVHFVPDELARDLLSLELPLPDRAELVSFLRGEAAGRADDADLERLARALAGLTLDEAHHALRRAVPPGGGLAQASMPALLEEKRALVGRSGVIDFVPDDTGIDRIGGLDTLKTWLLERRVLFQQRESLDADIVPKGLLLMGISGCGKSLAAKAIATCFDLPLYRIDMVQIFSGRHGTPEGAFAQACRTLEQIAPAVVWFDEIEMGISGQDEGASSLGRIFAFFLTWMQEKTRGLFVAATANRIDLLPAEMIRKGRFDEVFFVDLPQDFERVEIFRIHLQRRGIDPERFDLPQLTRFTEGWTGAEIEQCVVAALTRAQVRERELSEQDLLDATHTVVPLSRTMKEQVDHITSWAYDRAVRASSRDLI